MPNGRKGFAALAFTIAITLGLGLIAALPANAMPLTRPQTTHLTIKSAKARVHALYRRAEVISQRYDAARVRLKANRTQMSALSTDLGRERSTVSKMRRQVAQLVVDQYQGQQLSTATQMVLSNDPSQFIAHLNAVSAYDNQRGQVMIGYRTELGRLALRQKAVHAEVAKLAVLHRQLGRDQARINRLSRAAKAELAKLTPPQQASVTQAGPVANAAPASGRAAAAVAFAMAQVGKPYVYGAAGPSAYDCSGLTMAAWGAAGVALPHDAAAQMGMGAPVSESQLQPGDLVFYYSPVSHVGLYIGNGMIVNAENPSVGVVTAPVNSMPYAGAVRPG